MRLAARFVTVGIISVVIFNGGHGSLDTFTNRYYVCMICVFHMVSCMFVVPLGSQLNVVVYFELMYTNCVIVFCSYVAVITVINTFLFVGLISEEVLSIIGYLLVTTFVGVFAAIVIDRTVVRLGNWSKVDLFAG